jgi:hypothetical protein
MVAAVAAVVVVVVVWGGCREKTKRAERVVEKARAHETAEVLRLSAGDDDSRRDGGGEDADDNGTSSRSGSVRCGEAAATAAPGLNMCRDISFLLVGPDSFAFSSPKKVKRKREKHGQRHPEETHARRCPR